MKKSTGFVVIENASDFDNNVIQEGESWIIIHGFHGVIYHNGDRTNFPQYYKRGIVEGNHLQDDFVRCTLSDVIAEIDNNIKYYQLIINHLLQTKQSLLQDNK